MLMYRYLGRLWLVKKRTVCICACEHSSDQPLLMGFLPYNHLILYDTDFLNVMHVSEYSRGPTSSDTPAHTCRVAAPRPLPPSLLQRPLTREATSVSPVGMVTLLSPGQPRAGWSPHTLMGVWTVCVCVWCRRRREGGSEQACLARRQPS